MSSEIYKIVETIIFGTDLLQVGQKLIEFGDSVYKEKNRTTILNNFYEQLYQFAFNKYMFGDLLNNDKKDYYICDEKEATRMFLALRIPKKTTTVKSILGVKAFGEDIISNYYNPVGKCISEESLENILQYLEKEYSLCSKLFSNKKAVFIRIHNSHIEYNSECLTTKDKKGIISNHFFLYHMKKKRSLNPEAVLFHELSHALHVQRFGDITKVPDYIIDILHDLCFPSIKQMDNISQSELFADVLSVGFMYKTPYEKFDLYKEIHPDDKEIFKMLVEKIIESI